MKKRIQFFNLGFLFLIRLLARNYFFSFSLPIINFILPLIIAFICYEILPIDLVIPGLVINPILTVGMISLPLTLASWNASIIIKRLKLCNIPGWQILCTFFLFYFLISLLSVIAIIGFLLIYTELKNLVKIETIRFVNFLKRIEYLKWSLGVFLLICISLSIGLVISYSTFRFQTALFIGLSFYLIQAFLVGVFLSLDLIIKNKSMLYFSYSSPIFYPMRMIQTAWLKNQIFQTLPTLPKPIPLFMYENWKIAVNDFEKPVFYAISFSNKYWLHGLISVGFICVFSTISLILFKNYRPK